MIQYFPAAGILFMSLFPRFDLAFFLLGLAMLVGTALRQYAPKQHLTIFFADFSCFLIIELQGLMCLVEANVGQGVAIVGLGLMCLGSALIRLIRADAE